MKNQIIFFVICSISISSIADAQKVNVSKLRAKKVDTLIIELDFLSFSEVMDSAKFAFVDESINADDFSSKATGSSRKDTVLVIYFGRIMSSKSVIAKMSYAGIYPGTSNPLFVVGAQYPELQKKYPIVALGSVDETKMLPVLEYNSRITNEEEAKTMDERDVILVAWDGQWAAEARFIALLNKPAKYFTVDIVKAKL
ncbi:hypothetical protein COB64_01310 [Candidatus Wolfebacteria bacterium]|nr:MAG: hypothetical protein COB64_01310 [Candidatus Wolfebacteria bacterium]